MNARLIASWAAAFIVGTLLWDWYAVAAVGAVGGWFLVGRKPFFTIALSAALAWWLLLLVTWFRGEVGALTDLLSEVMGMPNAALYLAVGIFPALLAGSAALLSGSVREGLDS